MHTATRTPSRRRFRRGFAAVGLTVAAALTTVAVPTAARADLQPCDIIDPDCDPMEYNPPRYNAIGVDSDDEDAYDEAAAEAAAHCPGGAYDVLKVRGKVLTNGDWQFTITYTCG
jgi:hypothetical protein